MSSEIEILSTDDVVCLIEDEEYSDSAFHIKNRFSINQLFEFGDLTAGISKLIGLSSEIMRNLEDGIPCRVMRTQQKGWRLGKIRLKVELQFIPDKPIAKHSIDTFDSPLDEIRKISEL